MTDPSQAGTPGEPKEGGTPEGAGTPSPSTEGGTSETVEQLQARLAALEREKQQHLGEKSRMEADARRVQELEAQIEAMRGSGSPPATPTDPNLIRQQNIQRLFGSVAERDPEQAQLMAELMAEKERVDRERFQQLQNQAQWDREMKSVPIEKQAEVESRARRLGIGPHWAYRDLLAEEHLTTQKDLAEQRRRLAEEEERRKRGTVETVGSPAIPKASPGSEITLDEYDRLIELAMNGSKEEKDEAKSRLRLVDLNKVTIRYG